MIIKRLVPFFLFNLLLVSSSFAIDLHDFFEKNNRGIVSIFFQYPKGHHVAGTSRQLGTGIVIHNGEYIVAPNAGYHAGKTNPFRRTYSVLHNDGLYSKVIDSTYDSLSNLSLLKISEPLGKLPVLNHSDEYHRGSVFYNVRYLPRGRVDISEVVLEKTDTVTGVGKGLLVSGKGKNPYYQGVVLDTKGRIVGLMMASIQNKKSNKKLGIVLSISAIQEVTRSLRLYGKVYRAWLGVRVADLVKGKDKQSKDQYGVRVSSVEEQGAAKKAGVMKDDIILEVNGQKIKNVDHLVEVILSFKVKEEVTLLISRAGNPLQKTFLLGER